MKLRIRLPVVLMTVGLALGGSWVAWLGSQHLGGWSSVLDRAEATFADLRLLIAAPREGPAKVAIVALDDPFVAAEGGYPVGRRRLADLVEAIAAAGARALAIDLLFIDQGDEAGNAALASALAELPTVIAAAGRFDGPRRSAVPQVSEELRPISAFAAIASVGLVNVSTDEGGTPRHVPMVLHTAHGPAPSFALRAASLFRASEPVLGAEGAVVGAQTQALDLGWHLPLRFYGPAGSIRTISARAVLENEPDASLLNDRLVVLGATATGIGDRFSTPFDPVLPGVEVLATAIANLLEGSGLVRDSRVRRIDLAAALALTLAGAAAVALLPLLPGLILFGLLVLGWLAAVAVLFAHGYWLSMTLPLVGPLPAVAVLAAIREVIDRRKGQLVARSAETLGRFQAPLLARRISEDPDFLREPREQLAAILFVDLSGFTQLSETIGLTRTREMLKEYHTLVADESQARDGIVLAFMGDGAMIVFGMPDPAPDDGARALETAHGISTAARTWIARHGMDLGTPGIRIGVHYGPVVVSRLGHDEHQQITAAGDAVNVASRLMEVGKAHGAAIAASSALIEAARRTGKGLTDADDVRVVDIRGRRERVTAFLWRGGPLPV